MVFKNFGSLLNRIFVFNKIKASALGELLVKKINKKSPFITVSREPGSGGKLIAERVAKHLGFKFYDTEIIARIAKDKMEEKEFEDLYDEKELNIVDEILTSFVKPNLMPHDKFVRELENKIKNVTLKGSCVILGRGSNFFTDKTAGFHVRITAPFDYRVEKTIIYEYLNEKDAKERVKSVSNERNKFVEKYFERNIDDSEYYDLILNRAHYSLEDAVAIIIHAFKKKMRL